MTILYTGLRRIVIVRDAPISTPILRQSACGGSSVDSDAFHP